MIEKIEPIPRIPEALRIAAAQGSKIVPFIGAGVSQIGGCPSWHEFAHAALKYFVDQGKISHAQLDQISSLSSRVKLSVALDLQRKFDLPINFQKMLEPADAKKKTLGDKIYGDLSSIATTFVTTNYDEWLDKPPPPIIGAAPGMAVPTPPAITRQAFYKKADITPENLDVPNAVFHIHGSVLDRDSMVLTTLQYLERYSGHRIDEKGNNQENPFLTFLETLFKLKNVLFIGYGLNELEVLEYVVQKGIKVMPETKEEPRHYVIQGFFSHEIELARSLEGYFRQFGIGLLPYSRDEQDWAQLIDLVQHFAAKLPAGPALGLAKRAEMEGLLTP